MLGFKYIPSETQLRFDVAIKSLKLIVEYQGGQHFFDTYLVGAVKLYKTRDETKRALCERNGFTLVEVRTYFDANTIRAQLDLASLLVGQQSGQFDEYNSSC